MLPAPERHLAPPGGREALGQQQPWAGPALLSRVIQGLSTDLPVQPQLLTPRKGVLTTLGGRSPGCPPPHSWPPNSAHLHSALRSSRMPQLLGGPPLSPRLPAAQRPASQGRDAGLHLTVRGTRAQRGESACLGSHSKLVGSQTRACSLPLGLGHLVCAQAEDAQRKSGTNKYVHL